MKSFKKTEQLLLRMKREIDLDEARLERKRSRYIALYTEHAMRPGGSADKLYAAGQRK